MGKANNLKETIILTEKAIIISVSLVGGVYNCTLASDSNIRGLVVGDVLRYDYSGRYFAIISAINGNVISFKESEFVGTTRPKSGQELYRFGNVSNQSRQGTLLISQTDENTQALIVYDGVKNGLIKGREVVKIGNLGGIIDEDFGALTGYGSFLKNAYISGKIIAKTGSNLYTRYETDTLLTLLKSEIYQNIGSVDEFGKLNEKLDEIIQNTNNAIDAIIDYSSDSVLTILEKESVRREWDILKNEYGVVLKQISPYEEIDPTNFKAYFRTLQFYILPILNEKGNSDIDRDVFRSNFRNVYNEKVSLISQLTDILNNHNKNTNSGLKDLEEISQQNKQQSDAIKDFVNNIVGDNKITGDEAVALRGKLRELDVVHAVLENKANMYYTPSEKLDPINPWFIFNQSHLFLNSYIEGLFNTPVPNTTNTTTTPVTGTATNPTNTPPTDFDASFVIDIDRDYFNGVFSDYFKKREELENALLRITKEQAEKALNTLLDMANDGKITPQEKLALLDNWVEIRTTHPLLIERAKDYPQDQGIQQQLLNYQSMFANLKSYLKPIINDRGELTGDMQAVSIINPVAYNKVFTDYYMSRGLLENLMNDNLVDYLYGDGGLQELLDQIMTQLDGNYEVHFNYDAPYVPTLANDPAKDWLPSEYPEKVGDIFYNVEDGTTYVFIKKADGTYQWVEDTNGNRSIVIAELAKQIADSKVRIFVVQPKPPYNVSDIWIRDKEMYFSTKDRKEGEAFVLADWTKELKYDNTTEAINGGITHDGFIKSGRTGIVGKTGSNNVNKELRIYAGANIDLNAYPQGLVVSQANWLDPDGKLKPDASIPKFVVLDDGTVYMKDAILSGTIYATAGKIGNIEILNGDEISIAGAKVQLRPEHGIEVQGYMTVPTTEPYQHIANVGGNIKVGGTPLWANTGYLMVNLDKVKAGNADNADRWGGNLFTDYMNQPVKTTSVVKFASVEAPIGKFTTLTATTGNISVGTFSSSLEIPVFVPNATYRAGMINYGTDGYFRVGGVKAKVGDSDLWDGKVFSTYLDQAVKTTSNVTFGSTTVNGTLTAKTKIIIPNVISADANSLSAFNGYLYIGNVKTKAGDSDMWQGRLFADYMNQPVRTIDSPKFTGLSSVSFTSGFAGEGYRLAKDANGNYMLELDRLLVRKDFTVYELIVSQIRATNGSLWVTDGIKITGVTVSGANYVCSIDSDGGTIYTPFRVNDIIRCQKFNSKQLKYYSARVTATTNDTFTIVIIDGASKPDSGDELVRIGNTTDKNRQGAVYLTSSDSGAPFIDVIDGVTNANLGGKTKVRMGKLDGIIDADLGALSGYGFYGDNVYIKGKLMASIGSNVYTKDETNIEIGKVSADENLFAIANVKGNTFPNVQNPNLISYIYKGVPNTVYTLSTDIPKTGSVFNLFFGVSPLSPTSGASGNGVAPNEPRTITSSATGLIEIAIRNQTFLDEVYSGTTHIKLQRGEYATTWNPAIVDIVNSIKVGGRNLLPKSNNLRITAVGADVTYTNNADGSITIVRGSSTTARSYVNGIIRWDAEFPLTRTESFFNEGDNYTVSFKVRTTKVGTKAPDIYMKAGLGYDPMIAVEGGDVTINDKVFYFTGFWKKANPISIHIGVYTGDYIISEMKLEKGNIPTDWTPAPEDMQGELNDFKTSTNTQFNVLDGKIESKVSTTTFENFKIDNTKVINDIQVGGTNFFSIRKAETGKYLIETTGLLGASTGHAVSDFMAVKGSSNYIFSSPKIQQMRIVWYDANKVYVSGQLFSGLHGTSKLLISPANARFSRVSADITVSGGAPINTWKFEEGNKATSWSPNPEDIQLEINDISIGGRNFLLNSGRVVTNSVYQIARYPITVKPTVGNSYVCTIWGTLAPTKTRFSIYNSGGNITLANLVEISSGVYQAVFEWKNTGATTVPVDTELYVYAVTNAQVGVSTINNIKLESGNKGTDWTPAPEDYVNDLNNLQVGGRNYVPNSNDPTRFTPYMGSTLTKSVVQVPEWGAFDANRVISTGGTNIIRVLTSVLTPYNGQVVTSSGWFKNNGTKDISIYSNQGSREYILKPNEATRIVFKGIVGNGVGNLQWQIRPLLVADNVDFTWWRLQVEEGNLVSDWSPNPDDIKGEVAVIGNRVTTSETKIEQNSQAISLKAEKTTVDNLTTIVSNKADQSTVSSMETRLQSAEFKIQPDQINLVVKDQTQSIVDTKFNTIKVGGVNLLDNTGNFKTSKGWGVYTASTMVFNPKLNTLTMTSTGANARIRNLTNILLTDETYDIIITVNYYSSVFMVSFGGKMLNEAGGEAGSFNGIKTADISLYGNLKQSVWTYKMPKRSATMHSLYFYLWLVNSTFIDLVNIKVERGNIATDWSPSPNDVLSVGGTNLLQDSRLKRPFYFGTGGTMVITQGIESNSVRYNVTAGTNYGYRAQAIDRKLSVTARELYTLSFDIRGTVEELDYVYLMRETGGANANVFTPILLPNLHSINYMRVTRTIIAPWDSVNSDVMISTSKGGWFEIKNIKFEKGEVTTDWSASPIDVQNQITTVETRVTNSETRIDQNSQAISLKADNSTVTSLTTTVNNKADKSQVTALETRVANAELKITPDAINATVKEQTETIVNTSVSKIATDENLFSLQALKGGTFPNPSNPALLTFRYKGSPDTYYTLSTDIPKSGSNFDLWFGVSPLVPSTALNGVAINEPRTILSSSTGLIEIAFRSQGLINDVLSGKKHVKLQRGQSATAWNPATSDIIDSIQIGGRNTYSNDPAKTPLTALISGGVTGRNTGDYLNGFAFTGGSGGLGGVRLGDVITDNGWWTVSGWVRGTQAPSTPSFEIDIADNVPPSPRIICNNDNSWKYFEFSVLVNNYSATLNFVDFSKMTNHYFRFKDIKVENGNKASAWTPNPVDTQDQITTVTKRVAEAELKITPDAINATVKEQTETLIGNTVKNLIQNPLMGNIDQWDKAQPATIALTLVKDIFEGLSSDVMRYEGKGSNSIYSNTLLLDNSKSYRITTYIKKETASPNPITYLGLLGSFYGITRATGVKSVINSNFYFEVAKTISNTDWVKYEMYIFGAGVDTSQIYGLGENNTFNAQFPANNNIPTKFRVLNWNNTVTAPKTMLLTNIVCVEIDPFNLAKTNEAITRISQAELKITPEAINLTVKSQTENIANAIITIQDTRDTNELPPWYYSNYPKRTVREFKRGTAIALASIGANYCQVLTEVPWGDMSGGAVVQTAYYLNRSWVRSGTTAWSTWTELESTAGSQAKADGALTDSKTYTNTQFNVLNGAIQAKADKTYVDGINTRLNSAELKITPEAINLTVKSQTEEIASRMSAETLATGVMLYKNPTFHPDLAPNPQNNIITYGNNAETTLSRENNIADSPNPLKYGYKIVNTGYAGSRLGFFAQATMTRANAIFISRFVAKIPKGWKVQDYHNSTGTGGNAKRIWLTSQEGTGFYEEYLFKLVSGATGTFSTGNHFALIKSDSSTPTPTPTAPVTSYLVWATVYDMSNVGDTPTITEISSSFTMTNNKISLMGKDIEMTGKVTFSSLDTSTQGTINTTTNTANTALNNANSAQGTANTANGTANTALNNANNAQGTANNALNTANTANGTANTANNTANNALGRTEIITFTANNKKVLNPVGFSNGANAIGTICITTPITSSYMFTMNITGYVYLSNSKTDIDLMITGYAYQANNIINHNYSSRGAFTPKVFLSRDSSGRLVVRLGEPNTTWQYPKVNVDYCIISHGTVPDSYKTGWSVIQSTTIPSSIVYSVEPKGTDIITELGTTSGIVEGWKFTGKTTINGGRIETDTITAVQIKAGTITAVQIAGRTITADRLVAGTITANEIGANAITAVKIQAGTITGDKILSRTITADKIAVGTLTAQEIKTNSITGDRIVAKTLNATQIDVENLLAQNVTASGTITATNLRVTGNSKIGLMDISPTGYLTNSTGQGGMYLRSANAYSIGIGKDTVSATLGLDVPLAIDHFNTTTDTNYGQWITARGAWDKNIALTLSASGGSRAYAINVSAGMSRLRSVCVGVEFIQPNDTVIGKDTYFLVINNIGNGNILFPHPNSTEPGRVIVIKNNTGSNLRVYANGAGGIIATGGGVANPMQLNGNNVRTYIYDGSNWLEIHR